MSFQLSADDRRYVQELYAKGVLFEDKLDDLSSVCLITDAEFPNPSISMDVTKRPAYTFAVLGGALALHRDSTDFIIGDLAMFAALQRQIKYTFQRGTETIALVVCIPSLTLLEENMTFLRALDLLVQMQQQWQTGFAHHKLVRAFVYVHFDGLEYCYAMDPAKFRVWYNEYECDVLARDDRALEDDEEEGIRFDGSQKVGS